MRMWMLAKWIYQNGFWRYLQDMGYPGHPVLADVVSDMNAFWGQPLWSSEYYFTRIYFSDMGGPWQRYEGSERGPARITNTYRG